MSTYDHKQTESHETTLVYDGVVEFTVGPDDDAEGDRIQAKLEELSDGSYGLVLNAAFLTTGCFAVRPIDDQTVMIVMVDAL